MNTDRLDQVLQSAVAAGLLPAAADRPVQEGRPWPVVLLTALGAWLAAVPLLVMLGMLLGDVIQRGVGLYLVGGLLLGGAVVVLRARAVPLFVEQLAVPALLVGGGALGMAFDRDWPDAAGFAVLAAIACGLAIVIPRPWLRTLLGAACGVLVALAWQTGLRSSWDLWSSGALRDWLAWHGCLVLCALAHGLQGRAHVAGWPQPRHAAALESLTAGWLLAALAGLAFWSGMSFLVGASVGAGAGSHPGVASLRGHDAVVPVISAVLAAAGAVLVARRWASLRQPAWGGMALVLVVLSWFLPALGAVVLAMAYAAVTQRWALATAAAVAGAWIVGTFYYQLSWPLAYKAGVLLAAGAALALLAAWARHRLRPQATQAAAPVRSTWRRERLGLLASGVAVLAVANIGIWQKESVIAHGQPVLVALAPVDPRSLMQGDYMRLNFDLSSEIVAQLDAEVRYHRPQLVVRLDAHGVATPLRLHSGGPLAAGEKRIELTPKNGRWVLVSDAWFFEEGDAARWEAARYGEFRVAEDGRALLVGLRDAQLKPL